MKKILYLTALLTLFSTYSFAQKNLFLGSWEVAFPMNGDVLSKTSYAGARFDFRHMINPKVSVGVATSWNSFEQYTPRETYQYPGGTGAVTTDLIKSVYTAPITLGLHYYMMNDERIKPYVGIGIGTQYTEQSLFFNVYEISDSNWGFVVRPEVGLIVTFTPMFGGFVSASYNYATNDVFKSNHIDQIALNIGVAFTMR